MPLELSKKLAEGHLLSEEDLARLRHLSGENPEPRELSTRPTRKRSGGASQVQLKLGSRGSDGSWLTSSTAMLPYGQAHLRQPKPVQHQPLQRVEVSTLTLMKKIPNEEVAD